MIAFAVVTVAALVLAAAVVYRCRPGVAVDRLMSDSATRKVVVTLSSGETFDGVIAEVDDRSVLLQRPRILGDAQSSPVRVDGDLILPRCDIAYLQRP